MEILKDTQIGKAVGSLNKLARQHPGISACDHIASKARSVLTTRVPDMILLHDYICKFPSRSHPFSPIPHPPALFTCSFPYSPFPPSPPTSSPCRTRPPLSPLPVPPLPLPHSPALFTRSFPHFQFSRMLPARTQLIPRRSHVLNPKSDLLYHGCQCLECTQRWQHCSLEKLVINDWCA